MATKQVKKPQRPQKPQANAKPHKSQPKEDGKTANWKAGQESANSGGTFWHLKDGDNLIRLATDYFTHVRVHWLDMGNNKFKRSNCVIPATKKMDGSKCPLCEAQGNSTSISDRHTYYFPVMVGTRKQTKEGKKYILFDPEVQIMEVGPKVGGLICGFANDIQDDPDGEWEGFGIHSIEELNLKISKTGKGLNTQYTVTHLANAKSKVNGDIAEIPDLDALCNPPTKKEIQEFLDAAGGDMEEEGSFDEEEDTPKRKKSHKQEEEEEEEEEEELDEEEEELDEEEDTPKRKKSSKQEEEEEEDSWIDEEED